MSAVEANPTDEDLFDFAEKVLTGIKYSAEPGFIRSVVLEQRDLWTLLYKVHRNSGT
jgi:hypothetical protein